MKERARLHRGVVSPRYGTAAISSRTTPPSASLAHVVQAHWVARWDLEGRPGHTIHLVADPCVNVAFEAGRSRVVGVWTRLWERTLEGRGLIRAVKLRAGAARRVFHQPSHTLTDLVQPLAEVLGEQAQAVERAVLAPEDDAIAARRLEAWLDERLRSEPDGQIALAVAAVEHARSGPHIRTVEQLADALEMPRRSLQRLFRDYVGAPPKWVIRWHRLQEAATRIERGELVSLADLAFELGYADQSHLSRDFSRAVGRPPTTLLGRH